MGNLTVNTNNHVEGVNVETSHFTKPLAQDLVLTFGLLSNPSVTRVPFFIAKVDNNIVKDHFLKFAQGTEDETGNSVFSDQNDSVSFSLSGDPWNFPFDHYLLDQIFVFPLRNIALHYTPTFDKRIYSSWTPSNASSPALNTGLSGTTLSTGTPNYLLPSGAFTNLTYLSTHIDFKRNFTVATITIPLLAIFYLLGAIFILENTPDQLSVRVTLGIFAFVFAFNPVIATMKPSSIVTKGPTIADSIVSIILVATIAFSVSSVISSSPVIKNKFPRGSIWIDRIVFFFVSGIVIWYFVFSIYSIGLIMWIVPVIIFGLGYGLLLRTSGLKIAETLENLFKKGVKRIE